MLDNLLLEGVAPTGQGRVSINLVDDTETTTSSLESITKRTHRYATQMLRAFIENRRQFGNETVVDSIPPAILANWDRLRRSQLSSNAFESLILSARNRATPIGRGLGPPEQTSLQNFLHFWSYISVESTEPEISVSPRGYVQAEWFKDDDHFLVIEFRPDRSMLFSLWDDGPRVEGWEILTKDQNLEKMLRARTDNPLLWTE